MTTALLWLTVLFFGAQARADSPETPTQIRQILAQSFCLGVAYPGGDIARDVEGVYAVYIGQLPLEAPLEARRKIEALAAASKPSEPTPVGGHNLALAKCALFAQRTDVQRLLGADR